MAECFDVDERKAAALAALAELGDTPDKIAESLRVQGIRGIQQEGTACPLHYYLERRCPVPGFEWDVSGANITADGVSVPYPPGCEKFIQDFDDGKYPALIAENDFDDSDE